MNERTNKQNRGARPRHHTTPQQRPAFKACAWDPGGTGTDGWCPPPPVIRRPARPPPPLKPKHPPPPPPPPPPAAVTPLLSRRALPAGCRAVPPRPPPSPAVGSPSHAAARLRPPPEAGRSVAHP